MGNFSKQWMLQECNLRHHCLDVELINPMFVNDESVRHIYVTEVLEPEIAGAMARELPSVSNDYDGTIRVNGFTTSPTDKLNMEISLDNILRVFERG